MNAEVDSMHIERRDNFYILTGASGSGKSSIIAALREQGYECVDEVGRQVVQQQIRIGGDATPWQDHIKLRELILAGAMHAYAGIDERYAPVFFDRGIPEGIGYSDVLGVAVPRHHYMAAAIFRSNTTVFVTPPWRAIYVNDPERQHSFDDSLAAYDAVRMAYMICGYQLLDVPQLPVEARATFILDYVTERML